jgi:hypothetical protein
MEERCSSVYVKIVAELGIVWVGSGSRESTTLITEDSQRRYNQYCHVGTVLSSSSRLSNAVVSQCAEAVMDP